MTVHTNLAEGFFARMRASIAGAWHRTSIQNLEEYGYEIAWRQTMVGSDNKRQLEDLIHRVLTSGRSKRFADYWGKRADAKPKAEQGELGGLVEVSKYDLGKPRGRPRADTVRTKVETKPKRPYVRSEKPPAS